MVTGQSPADGTGVEDHYARIESQYRPEFQVGSVADDGRKRYEEINRLPSTSELDDAYEAARRAGCGASTSE